MSVLVRTKPIRVYYVTGTEAAKCRNAADGTPISQWKGLAKPGFVTESFGSDGFVWDTAEEFEDDFGNTP